MKNDEKVDSLSHVCDSLLMSDFIKLHIIINPSVKSFKSKSTQPGRELEYNTILDLSDTTTKIYRSVLQGPRGLASQKHMVILLCAYVGLCGHIKKIQNCIVYIYTYFVNNLTKNMF